MGKRRNRNTKVPWSKCAWQPSGRADPRQDHPQPTAHKVYDVETIKGCLRGMSGGRKDDAGYGLSLLAEAALTLIVRLETEKAEAWLALQCQRRDLAIKYLKRMREIEVRHD